MHEPSQRLAHVGRSRTHAWNLKVGKTSEGIYMIFNTGLNGHAHAFLREESHGRSALGQGSTISFRDSAPEGVSTRMK